MSRAGSTYLFFSCWLRSPSCLRNGQWVKLSRGAFRFGVLERWQYFCSPVLVIRHNQVLSQWAVDHKPGTIFTTQTAMANHCGTRRRRNSVASFDTILVSFCPILILST